MGKMKAKLDEEPIVEIIELVEWNGIKIDAHYRSKYCGCAHLALHVVDPPLAPIPVSDTGYRSCFDPKLPEHIAHFGSVTAFTKSWLDNSAKSQAWQAYIKEQQKPKQLDLFG